MFAQTDDHIFLNISGSLDDDQHLIHLAAWSGSLNLKKLQCQKKHSEVFYYILSFEFRNPETCDLTQMEKVP